MMRRPIGLTTCGGSCGSDVMWDSPMAENIISYIQRYFLHRSVPIDMLDALFF